MLHSCITSAYVDRFFKISLLLDAARNLQYNCHHMLHMLLHYLAKLKMPLLPFSHYSCYKITNQNSFIYFSSCNSYYLTNITTTCFCLNINCLSCVRSVASSLSSSRTICQLTERAQALSVSHSHT